MTRAKSQITQENVGKVFRDSKDGRFWFLKELKPAKEAQAVIEGLTPDKQGQFQAMESDVSLLSTLVLQVDAPTRIRKPKAPAPPAPKRGRPKGSKNKGKSDEPSGGRMPEELAGPLSQANAQKLDKEMAALDKTANVTLNGKSYKADMTPPVHRQPIDIVVQVPAGENTEYSITAYGIEPFKTFHGTGKTLREALDKMLENAPAIFFDDGRDFRHMALADLMAMPLTDSTRAMIQKIKEGQDGK